MLIASDVLVGSTNSPMVERRPVDSGMIMQVAVIPTQAAKPMPLEPNVVTIEGATKGAKSI